MNVICLWSSILLSVTHIGQLNNTAWDLRAGSPEQVRIHSHSANGDSRRAPGWHFETEPKKGGTGWPLRKLQCSTHVAGLGFSLFGYGSSCSICSSNRRHHSGSTTQPWVRWATSRTTLHPAIPWQQQDFLNSPPVSSLSSDFYAP